MERRDVFSHQAAAGGYTSQSDDKEHYSIVYASLEVTWTHFQGLSEQTNLGICYMCEVKVMITKRLMTACERITIHWLHLCRVVEGLKPNPVKFGGATGHQSITGPVRIWTTVNYNNWHLCGASWQRCLMETYMGETVWVLVQNPGELHDWQTNTLESVW